MHVAPLLLWTSVVWLFVAPPILWEHLSESESEWEHLSDASPPLCERFWVNVGSSEWTDPWTGEKTIELFWFHLAEIEAIWETGQLTTKFAIETVWFFWNILSSFSFWLLAIW